MSANDHATARDTRRMENVMSLRDGYERDMRVKAAMKAARKQKKREPAKQSMDLPGTISEYLREFYTPQRIHYNV